MTRSPSKTRTSAKISRTAVPFVWLIYVITPSVEAGLISAWKGLANGSGRRRRARDAEQRLVGRAQVGGGQPAGVELPDLLDYGDGDVDVLAAAGGVEALRVRADLGAGVQGLV